MKNKPFVGSGIIKTVKKLEAAKCSQRLNRASASGVAVSTTQRFGAVCQYAFFA